MRFLLFVLFACLSSLSAQVTHHRQIKATPESPKVGETVILEVIDPDLSHGVTVDWANMGGEGEGVWVAKSGSPGKFTPAKPGAVTIVCILSGGIADTISTHLQVVGEAPSPAKTETPAPAGAQAAAGAPAPQKPPAPPDYVHLPGDAVAMSAIVDSKEAQVTPTGSMGDALDKRVVLLAGGVDCKFDVECHSFTYNLPNQKEGWAAFAWQVVPQGQKWNWGEHKGADISKQGFKSLRVSAKADLQFGVFPKVEFKSGGNIGDNFTAMHPNTYLVSTGVKPLTADWHEFCLDISHVSSSALKDVVSPLTLVVSGLYNPPRQLGLFIDGAYFSTRPCGLQ